VAAHCFYVNANSRCTNSGQPCTSALAGLLRRRQRIHWRVCAGWIEVNFDIVADSSDSRLRGALPKACRTPTSRVRAGFRWGDVPARLQGRHQMAASPARSTHSVPVAPAPVPPTPARACRRLARPRSSAS
jgi:hypothetical protein